MEIIDPDKCCGCAVCHDTCPVGAIKMMTDGEGFVYPRIHDEKCINCGRCKTVCPVVNRGPSREPIAVYAAQAKDDELRMDSSSGGIFSLLSRRVLLNGGMVFGAGWDHTTWRVIHKSAVNEDELDDLRGSKYVQSDMRGIYKQVKDELDEGREVLFTGTPCQVAALRLSLGNPYDNLLMVDVICHAVPSPLVWQKYLEERVCRQYSAGGASKPLASLIKRISYRCKKNSGWKKFSLSLRFANDTEYHQDLFIDPFLRGFLSELYNRPSCHQCQCRELRSGSDLTIADYWNVAERFPDLDDDKGTSLVLINTEKGRRAYEAICSVVEERRSDFAHACKTNPAILVSKLRHPNRSLFFRRIIKTTDRFDDVVCSLLRPQFRKRIHSLADAVLRNIGLRH